MKYSLVNGVCRAARRISLAVVRGFFVSELHLHNPHRRHLAASKNEQKHSGSVPLYTLPFAVV